jgi:enterochelin esterase-like enzyme
MKLQKPIIIMVALCSMIVYGTDAITGRVVNSSSVALAGAKVWLKTNPAISDSTGADGKFSLSRSSSVVAPMFTPDRDAQSFCLHNGRLEFSLTTPQHIAVALFDAGGKKVVMITKGMKDQGRHSIALGQATRSLASGAYLLRFVSNEIVFEIRLVIAGGCVFTNFRTSMARKGYNAKAQLSADSLIVLRMGYEIKKMALANVAARDVGDVSLTPRTYKKETTVTVKTGRNIEVILPSDYNELYLLPVLYLLHGGGTDETTWRVYGYIIDTLNKFADKENMQPMIIITPNAGGSTGYGYYGKTADPFYTDLTVDIKKYVESHYKVDTSRYSRAISGLSMGSMQTWNLTLFYPTLWGYSFPMSAGLLKNGGFTVAKLKADVSSGLIDVAAVNQLKIFKIFSNPTDIAFGDTDTTCMLAKDLGITLITDFTTKTSGGHTFPFWNEVVKKYAPTLFK